MTAIAEEWLAAEPLLIDRVKAQVAGLRAVYSASEITTLTAQQDPRAAATPAAHVMYGGDQVVDVTDNGELQTVDQLWCVAIVARNDRGPSALRAEVSPLLIQTIQAISGWECGIAGMRAFRRARLAWPPRFTTSGSAIYPLLFAARVFA